MYGFASLSFRVVLTLLSWLGFTLGFWLLSSVAGGAAGVLMFLPVIVTGCVWGFRIGLLAGLFALAVVAYPFHQMSQKQSFLTTVLSDLGPGTVVAIIIGGTVGYLRDLRLELYAQHQQLLQRSQQDGLTELLNRSAFEAKLTEVLAESSTVAVLFIDVDGFKTVNDTYGHAVGDEVLRYAAMRLRRRVRRDDLVARLGGDEFVVALPGMEAGNVARIAEGILDAFTTSFNVQEESLRIGSSIGVSMYPEDAHDIDTLVKLADQAMYEVKQSGKNDYAFFSG